MLQRPLSCSEAVGGCPRIFVRGAALSDLCFTQIALAGLWRTGCWADKRGNSETSEETSAVVQEDTAGA